MRNTTNNMTAQQNDVGVAASPRVTPLKQTPTAGNIYAATFMQQEEQTSIATNSFTAPTKNINSTTTINSREIIKTANNTEAHHENTNNNKFLERVLAAMNSPLTKSSATKPPIPPASTKNGLSNRPIENAKILGNGTGKMVSKHVTAQSSVNTTSSTTVTRPFPLPTNSTVEKQQHMVNNKQLSRSNLEYFTQQQENSTHQLSHAPRVNGFGVGVSSTTSVAGKVKEDVVVNNHNQNINVDVADETPIVFVSLKLPLSKADKMATSTTSKYNGDILTTNSERLRNSSSYFSTRSPSPANSLRSNTSSSRCSSVISNATTTSRSSFSRLQTPPRRVFPQTYTRGNGSIDVYEMHKLESSPVVFDANMSFVLGCKRQPVHQTLRPTPSYQEDQTSSAYLSEKIQNFLRRTDHVQEEWSAMGRRSRRTGSTDSGRATPTNSLYDDYDTISLIERQRERKSMERSSSIGRSRSSQNILTKAFQLSKTLPSTPTSRSNSMARDVSESGDDRTICEEDDRDFDEVGRA